jgi:hypothetical protein
MLMAGVTGRQGMLTPPWQPDPTSDVFRGPCTLIVWFVMLITVRYICHIIEHVISSLCQLECNELNVFLPWTRDFHTVFSIRLCRNPGDLGDVVDDASGNVHANMTFNWLQINLADGILGRSLVVRSVHISICCKQTMLKLKVQICSWWRL